MADCVCVRVRARACVCASCVRVMCARHGLQACEGRAQEHQVAHFAAVREKDALAAKIAEAELQQQCVCPRRRPCEDDTRGPRERPACGVPACCVPAFAGACMLRTTR